MTWTLRVPPFGKVAKPPPIFISPVGPMKSMQQRPILENPSPEGAFFSIPRIGRVCKQWAGIVQTAGIILCVPPPAGRGDTTLPAGIWGGWRQLVVGLRDLGRSAVSSWGGGIFGGRLASRRWCRASASLRKLGKQRFPNLRNLAVGCGLGAWGRREIIPLTSLGAGS